MVLLKFGKYRVHHSRVTCTVQMALQVFDRLFLALNNALNMMSIKKSHVSGYCVLHQDHCFLTHLLISFKIILKSYNFYVHSHSVRKISDEKIYQHTNSFYICRLIQNQFIDKFISLCK